MGSGNAICLHVQTRQCKSDDSRTTQLGSVYSNLITKGNPHKVKWASLRHVCFQRPSANKINMLHKYDLTTQFQVAVTGNLKKLNTRRPLDPHLKTQI